MTTLLDYEGETHPLTRDTDHASSRYGLGVLIWNGDILDRASFRFLRDYAGATIRTDEPDRVAGALGVSSYEPGILPL